MMDLTPAVGSPRVHSGPTVAFSGAALMALVGVILLGPGETEGHLALLLLLLPFFGIPHGALDYALARRLMRPRFGRLWGPGFVGLYLLAMAVVILFWRVQPTLSLAAFIALTYYHFSTGDTLSAPHTPILMRIGEWVARGGIILFFPAVFDRTAVQQLLSYLAPETGVAGLLDAMAALAPICCLAASLVIAASLVSYVRKRRAVDLIRAVELFILAVIFSRLPALLAFTIHFNFLHSLRHMLGVADCTDCLSAPRLWTRMFRLSLPVTLTTLLLGAGAYGLLGGVSFDTSRLVQVVFIGIASMTYPHIVVVSLAGHTDRGVRLPAASIRMRAAAGSSALDPAP